MKKENETYLSDWLANTISDVELKQIISEEDFLAYQKLKYTLDDLTISSPDLDQNFEVIKQKLKAKNIKKERKVIPLWRLSIIAASLLLLFGLYQAFYFSNTIATATGTTKKLTLPDNSKVTLNAKSKISFPNFFQLNRTLDLQGEAYFEVQKGSTFTVKTSLGSIKVLGTKFNVNAFNDYFEVTCYEGKVKVQINNKYTILTPTEIVRFYRGNYENWAENNSSKPLWLKGESEFKNVPLQYVINQFEKQYNVKIDYPEKVKEVKFTGTFTNKNRETALQSICIPIHLKVIQRTSRKIIISE